MKIAPAFTKNIILSVGRGIVNEIVGLRSAVRAVQPVDDYRKPKDSTRGVSADAVLGRGNAA